MKSKYIFALLFLFFGILGNIAQNSRHIIVQLDKGVEVNTLIGGLAVRNPAYSRLRPIKCLSKTLNIWLLQSGNGNVQVGDKGSAAAYFLRELQENNVVLNAHYNRSVVLRAVPNDSLFAKQWQFRNKGVGQSVKDADINAPEAWDITTGGKTASGDEIVIAIIDGGVDLHHPDLRANIWQNHAEIPNNEIDDDGNGYIDDRYGWNFRMENASVDNGGTGHWHGTSVAGIIGAQGNNGVGVSGVNWEVKMMNLVANSTVADIIAAYDYVLDMRLRYNETDGREGAFIVATNTSLGISRSFPEEAPIWCAMFDVLGEAGILSVAATANENINVDLEGDLPTNCSSNFLISVTSTNPADRRDELTAYGLESVDLGAPGVAIVTTANQSHYDFFEGTSAATPHVAGAIGLLYSAKLDDFMNDTKENPEGTALQVKAMVLSGTDPLASLREKCRTGGRLNLYTSLNNLHERYAAKAPIRRSNSDIILNTLYPNPAKDVFTIDFTITIAVDDLYLQLYDVYRRRVFTQQLGKLSNGGHRIQVPLGTIAKGMYFVTINKSEALKLLVY